VHIVLLAAAAVLLARSTWATLREAPGPCGLAGCGSFLEGPFLVATWTFLATFAALTLAAVIPRRRRARYRVLVYVLALPLAALLAGAVTWIVGDRAVSWLDRVQADSYSRRIRAALTLHEWSVASDAGGVFVLADVTSRVSTEFEFEALESCPTCGGRQSTTDPRALRPGERATFRSTLLCAVSNTPRIALLSFRFRDPWSEPHDWLSLTFSDDPVQVDVGALGSGRSVIVALPPPSIHPALSRP
jgi:hypothetical protein